MNFSNQKLPSNKKFGILFFIIFSILSIYTYLSEYILLSYILVILTLTIGAATLFKPDLLKTFNKAWMLFGFTLNKIISPIIMGFIFYFLITPISLMGFFFGRDELRIKELHKKSYWIDISEDENKNFSFFKQY
tara:strand:- start:1248 stop:1649 length:402 start_codon:yes stop_codon:yes gene_type:complete